MLNQNVSIRPARAALIKLDNDPANTALTPKRPIRSRFSGTRTPRPPKRTAMEDRFAKPHKEKVVIAIVLGLIPSKYSFKCENATNSLSIIFSPKSAPAASASTHGILKRYITG